MDINKHIRDLEEEFKQIMNSILTSFEDSNSLNYAELVSKWEYSKNEVRAKMYAYIYNSISKEGVDLNNISENDHLTIKIITDIFPDKIESIINEYYYTKIRPIINQSLQ